MKNKSTAYKKNLKHFLLKNQVYYHRNQFNIYRGEEKSENFQIYKQRVLGQAKNGNLHLACEVYFMKIMLGRISNGS